jgi:hypothetical protein
MLVSCFPDKLSVLRRLLDRVKVLIAEGFPALPALAQAAKWRSRCISHLLSAPFSFVPLRFFRCCCSIPVSHVLLVLLGPHIPPSHPSGGRRLEALLSPAQLALPLAVAMRVVQYESIFAVRSS